MTENTDAERARVIGELTKAIDHAFTADVITNGGPYALRIALLAPGHLVAALRLLEADAGREVNVVELAEADAERRFGAASPSPAQEGA